MTVADLLAALSEHDIGPDWPVVCAVGEVRGVGVTTMTTDFKHHRPAVMLLLTGGKKEDEGDD